MTPEEHVKAILGDYDCWPHEAVSYDELAGQVYAAIVTAVAGEREACAALCDPQPGDSDFKRSARRRLAAAIRGRV